jgi:quercetin dioxygenase-like cupin family protein
MSEKPLIDAAREKLLSLGTETQFAANGIVSRTLLRTASGRVVLFGFAEGQELTEHTSTQHALVQILSGECEFSLAGQPHPLKTGDLLYMPPNAAHAVRATKQFSMLLTLFKPEAATDALLTGAGLKAMAGTASNPRSSRGDEAPI